MEITVFGIPETRWKYHYNSVGRGILSLPEITDRNVHNKFQHCFPASALVLEREMLVQEVAQDTSEYVIGCRRYPVTEMQQIIKRKHHRRSKQRIYNSNHDKFPEGLIKYFLQFCQI